MGKKKSDDRNKERIIDQKWEEIFKDYNVFDAIERDGRFIIKSSQINDYKEARLMTKFDYETSLPDIFYDNDLAILPIWRGGYVIGRFDAYHSLRTTESTLLKNREEIYFPDWIESIQIEDITSESTMLNAANASGMLADLLGEDEDIFQTVSGRMGSGEFTFNITDKTDAQKRHKIKVKNAQVEIDGGFETPDKLILFEAKNNITNTFLTRQLYYPYQLWAKQMKKEVVPVFLQYANGTFNFSICKFEDVDDYNSLKVVKRKNYIFGAESTSIDDLVDIQKNVKIVKENGKIPFPQANTISRIIGVLEAIRESNDELVTLEELTILNDFVYRQAQYYSRAAWYLELVDLDDDGAVTLSKTGKKYINANRKNKNLIIAEQILKHRMFNLVFERGLEIGKPLTQDEAYQFLDSTDVYDKSTLAASTRHRRAGTIASWVRYLFSLRDDY